MKAYIAFTKKEFCEFTRTYKLLIMGIVFILLGIMNPVTAKFTPLLLKELMPQGMEITIGAPSAMDSWMQFYKNVPQMGLIVLVIIFSGLMATEYSHGSLINVLTKGLPRHTVILAKFTVAFSIWTLSYVLCFGVTYAYTAYFWNGDGIVNIVFAAFCLWLFGVLLITAILLNGAILKSNYGCLLLTGLFVMLLYLLNIVPKIQEYSPLALAANNMSLLGSQMTAKDFTIPIIAAILISSLFLLSAIAVFNKKQL